MAIRTVVALVEIEFQIESDSEEEFNEVKQSIFDSYDFRTVGKMGKGFTNSMRHFGVRWTRRRSKIRSISERPFKKAR